MWQGFPVLVHGTTDRSRQFHHIGISVSSNEATADFDFVFKTIKAGVFDIFQKKCYRRCSPCNIAKNIFH
jgi:hypothetical protein